MSSLQSFENSPPVAIFCYCMSSILMTLTNKYVLSTGQFNFNCILLAIQGGVCALVIRTMKSAGIINFRNLNKEDAKVWFPISLLLVSMIYTASKAMQYLAIPIFTIFKNLTIILIAYGEVLWFGGRVSSMTLMSFLLIVLSSVVAAWADLTSNAATDAASTTDPIVGYFWMFSNCLSNAGFVLYLRKRIKVLGFSDLDTMYFNNVLSIPVLIVGSLLFEDWSAENVARNFPPDSKQTVIFLMVASGAFSLGISYCSGWCVRVTSSTTYSMVGALNKLPIALSGLVFFDTPATFGNCFAIFLGFCAGLVYAVARDRQKKEDDAKQTALPTSK